MSANDAKNSFGLLLDSARTEPFTVEKHGRPVVVMSIEEFERLHGKKIEVAASSSAEDELQQN